MPRTDAVATSMTLNPPPAVIEIVKRLEGAGFEAWCVGGAVRDALLDKQHLDWDIATSAVPNEVRRLFRNTVPIGIEHGTIGVLDADGVMHEVTTFRKDVETDGRHARVIFGASLTEDLARRDFTINAIAYSPSRAEVFDPFDGRGDLGRGIIRTVGDARQRMAEDHLRALRALRFAGRFAFEIERHTWSAVSGSTPFLKRLSAERVRQEIEKTMEQVARPSASFQLWRKSGALQQLIPSLGAVNDVELSYADFLSLPGLPGRPVRRSNRVTALFLPAEPSHVRGALRELRFSNSDASWISGQVERWRSEGPALERALENGQRPSPAEMRRWISRAGRMRTASLLRLCFAVWDARLAAGGSAPRATRELYGRMIRSAFRDAVDLGDLAIDGDDLRGIGIKAGPAVGRILSALLARVIDDPAQNQRTELLRLAREIAETDARG